MEEFFDSLVIAALKAHGFDVQYDEERKMVAGLVGVDTDAGLIRLGGVIDALIKMRSGGEHDAIRFSGCVLNVKTLMLETGRSDFVRLTEKEVALLQVLYEAGGVLSREDLLRGVWGYAENVETHTLETHIYRLRQKIEGDPSNPQVLKTAEDGYFLSV